MSAMQFDHDIFISYAHLDNQPLVKDSEGWVSQFHRALEVRIDQLLGKKSSVWRDPKLQGNDYYDDVILEKLPNAAVLVSVFTPRYVQSDSCKKELIRFCESTEKSGGLCVQDKTRIFKVLKSPVPVEDHPAVARDCLGYEFFKVDSVSGRARELNQVFGNDAEREFWIRLDDLAQDLCQLLNWLEEGLLVKPATEMFEKSNTVYLAQCSLDVREQYDAIRRDLLSHQYRVIPEQPLPLIVDELMPAISDALNQSCLSVHVIGESYGIVPEGTDKSLVELQNELAIERYGNGDFSRLAWIPPGLTIDDDRQKHFLELLRSDASAQSDADLLETPLEDLKTQIHRMLSPTLPAEIEVPKPDEPAELRFVYLVCDSRDSERVMPIADYLFEHGCEVMLPAFDGDEAEVRADHEENLRNADGILIYYGTPNELWLRGKLRERLKSAGLGRTKPLKSTAILDAPPGGERAHWLRSHETHVIRQSNGFTPELLDPFLTDLRI